MTPQGHVRSWPRTRVVALVIIAIAALCLAYLRFAPQTAPVSVPPNAKAGDLTLAASTYTTESGDYAADVGTLVVPENRDNPRSRLMALPVTRIRARGEHPGEPIFHLGGGPGATNMEFARASRIADTHDVVLVGYRGIDGSVNLQCPEVIATLQRSADFLDDATMQAYASGMRACADRLAHDGVDLAGYSMAQRADDLDAARVALGYGAIDVLGESAGTRTAMIYAWRHPDSVHRLIMIGVNPPGHLLWDPATTDEQISYFAGLCSKDAACRAQTDDLAATVKAMAAHIPDRWGLMAIKAGSVRAASFNGLMNSMSATGPLSAPAIFDTWLSAAKGDPSGFWFMSVVGDLTFPRAMVWGELASMARADTRAAKDYFAAGGDPGSILGNPSTESLFAGGRLLDAWPTTTGDDDYSRVRTSLVETLLIGGTVDVSTPARFATDELLPALPNGHQVVLAELGHVSDFWTYQPEASARLIDSFLDSGKVDDSLYAYRAMDFTPGMTFTGAAKSTLAIMTFLAILSVLSLVWMGAYARRRAGFGRKTGVLLRSVYAVVLGLGGWLCGALIVMMTVRGVPLDDPWLVVMSVGVAVGPGIFFAWVRGDWLKNVTGLLAAVGGAVIGGWLGYTVADGLLAVVTTIAGSVLGANLAVITCDLWREHQSRDRPALPAQTDGLRRRRTQQDYPLGWSPGPENVAKCTREGASRCSLRPCARRGTPWSAASATWRNWLISSEQVPSGW